MWGKEGLCVSWVSSRVSLGGLVDREMGGASERGAHMGLSGPARAVGTGEARVDLILCLCGGWMPMCWLPRHRLLLQRRCYYVSKLPVSIFTSASWMEHSALF